MKQRPAMLLRNPAYLRIKQIVADVTGMIFYADKDETLSAILAARMADLGLTDLDGYLARLDDPEERDRLVSDVTIGETYFLRHLAQWQALESVAIPAVLERNARIRRLRCWSAGCAIGAEPYTLAILLREKFAQALEGWEVTILGTDLNRRALDVAQAGLYGRWSLRAVPDAFRERWFQPRGGEWEIDADIRRAVEFRRHNLIVDAIPPDGRPFDLILCRNVMIYFNAVTIAGLARAFHGALVESGWLVVSHAETTLRAFADFETVILPDTTLYRRVAGGTGEKPAPRIRAPDRSRRPAPPAPAAPAPGPVAPARERPRRAAPPPPSTRPMPPAQAASAPSTPHLPAMPDVSAIQDLIGRGEWQAAEAACTVRLKTDPLDAGTQALLGLLLEGRGDHDAAEGAYRRALFLDRGAVLAHYQLGCLLRRRGERVKAARAFRNVLDLLAASDDAAPIPGAADATAGSLRRAAVLQLDTLEER